MARHEQVPESPQAGPRRGAVPLGVLCVLCLLPAIQSAVAVCFQIQPRITYPLLKAAIVAAPLAAWLAMRRSPRQMLDDVGLKRSRCLGGLATGAVFAAVILAAYYAVLKGAIDATPVAGKARSLGLAGPWAYWAMAAFISLSNSLIEEYYWRGFILDQLRRRLDNKISLIAACGLLFGLHHVFVVAGMFSWQVGALFVFGTVVAGAVWSWQRVRGWSILDCYVSHILADLAGFWAGWDLITT